MPLEPDSQDGSKAGFGKFELVEQIGHGGMATVHRAILRGMGGFKREVVIKRILDDLAKDEHFIKMFIEEAKLSALLDHPNIVQVYDFGVIDNHYYISMELIDGLTLLKLRKHYRKRTPFPPEAAALIVHQVCLGLDYTHRLSREGQPLGLVHRDISPSNIMISAHGEVKLLDFGIAKAVEAIDDELTRTGTLKGKWSYMSPEQVVGSQVTYRSDIFACGIVLWEILTGRRLFKDKTDFLTLSNVANARVPKLSQYRADLPPIFDEVCQRALARDPEDRYASAEDLAEHLWTFLAERPCTNSNLAAMVTPLLQDDTVELSVESLQEISDSRSASFSASASESMPQSKESLTSLPRGEQEVVVPVLGHRRLITLATVGFALATVVVVVLLFALRPDPSELAATPQTVILGDPDAIPSQAAKPEPGPQTTPKEPKRPAEPKVTPKSPALEKPKIQRISVRISSSPKGAQIRLKGEATPRGIAPMTISLDHSNQPVTLLASLPDHKPLTRTVVPNKNIDVELELHPVPRIQKPEKPPLAVKKPKPTQVVKKPKPTQVVKKPKPTQVVKKPKPQKPPRRPRPRPKQVPNLKSGDLADPYGD